MYVQNESLTEDLNRMVLLFSFPQFFFIFPAEVYYSDSRVLFVSLTHGSMLH